MDIIYSRERVLHLLTSWTGLSLHLLNQMPFPCLGFCPFHPSHRRAVVLFHKGYINHSSAHTKLPFILLACIYHNESCRKEHNMLELSVGGLLFKCKFVFGLICKYTLLLTVRCEERRTVKDPCDPKKDRAPAVVIPLTLNRPEIGRLNFFPVYICQHTMRQGNNERGSCLKLIYFISYFFTQISHRLFFFFFFHFECPGSSSLPSISNNVNQPGVVATVSRVSPRRGGVVLCGWMSGQDVVGAPGVSNVRFSFLWPNHFSMGAQLRRAAASRPSAAEPRWFPTTCELKSRAPPPQTTHPPTPRAPRP